MLARVRGTFSGSKLMGVTLVGFLLGYLLLGYVLFYKGLWHLERVPLTGHVLSERIFYLMFFFFFLMLVFSNGVISYTTLFRSKETGWLLTLPVTHRALFFWKLIETLLVSSWGLVFLSAPLLAAYGQLNKVEPFYYVKAFLAYLPFVVIPAVIASWLLVLLVRFVNRYVVMGACAAMLMWVTITVATFYQTHNNPMEEGLSVMMSVDQVMSHTRLSAHPMMPSEWMSSVLTFWGKGREGGTFFFLLTMSYAMMGVFVTGAVAGPMFYPAWNASIRRRANASWRRSERRKGKPQALRRFKPPLIKRSTWALVRKDVRTFWREPAQWAQFLIVFGLLSIYILNLRNMGYEYDSPFWATVVTLLNLGVCSLALSTLTTRFVFPQFSLEGRRLWILGLAPFGLEKVLIQKFVMCCLSTASLTIGLIVGSSLMLRLPMSDVFLYAGVIGTMTIGLTALAIGLGTLFPNFRETNPAKIVSGFGGTLCLIVSFIYIVLCIAMLALPAGVKLAESGEVFGLGYFAALVAALVGVGGVTLLLAALPLIFAIRRVKNLENLGNL
ncbi:MAG: ABC-2 type transport system permease protein [Pseudoalteromonas tetraodonis]